MAKILLQQNEIKDFVSIVLFATQGLTWRPDIVAKKRTKEALSQTDEHRTVCTASTSFTKVTKI